jgi:fluoride exporter
MREENLPADSDIDVQVAGQLLEVVRAPVAVLAAIAGGGALGAVARWAIGAAWPPDGTGFPWATFLVNVAGCGLIGVLMVVVTDVVPGRRLLRPFLGVGVLGGFTTFATYVVEIEQRLTRSAAVIALLYLAGTVLTALPATAGGIVATRALLRACS